MKLSEDERAADIYIEQLCLQKDLDESLEIAETLKVLEAIVAEDNSESYQSHEPLLLKQPSLSKIASGAQKFAIK